MAERLFEAMDGGSPTAGGVGLLRLDRCTASAEIAQVTFSGGVSEYIYGREAKSYGDLGVLLAQEISARAAAGDPSSNARAKAFAPPSSARRNTPCR